MEAWRGLRVDRQMSHSMQFFLKTSLRGRGEEESDRESKREIDRES